MKHTLYLPDTFETTDVKTLLEEEWLVPRKVRHLLRTRKNVEVNDEPTMFHHEVKAGDKITLTFEAADYPEVQLLLGNQELVNVLFEDEHLIIVNKPVGMKTHPNQPLEGNTLQNHVAAYLASKDQIPYVVHRLDMETSGAILFAKNPFVLPIIGRMMEAKEIKRVYHGVAQGKIGQKSFTVEKPIARDRHDKRKRIASDFNGQNAITHVEVVGFQDNHSQVICTLDTGRTHQIRVHLDYMGYPLLGDPLYNPDSAPAERLMLHAASLELRHPFTKELVKGEALPSLW